MKIKTDEIASVIKQEIQQYASELEVSEVGRVVEVEALGPRRPPVLGQVDHEHPVGPGERLGDGGPVLPLPEETVQEDQRRTAIAESGDVKAHYEL